METFIKVPTIEQLKAMSPADRSAVLNAIQPGYLQSNWDSGDMGEVQYKLDWFKREMVDRNIGRIYEEMGNIQNAGHDPNGAGPLQSSARSRVEALQKLWNSLPDAMKGAQPTDYQTWVSGTPAVDPYGPGGALEGMSGEAGTNAYSALPKASDVTPKVNITEPMVGMQAPDGHVEFIPQSQVEAKKAERWGVINGTNPQLEAMKAEAEAKAAGTQNAPGPVRVGPTLWEQLRAQGITEDDIERRGNDIYVKPTSQFYTQAGGISPAPSDGGTTGAGTAGAGDTGTTGTTGTGSILDGVDTTGWPDYMVKTLQAYEEYAKKILAQGKVVNPNITIDQAKIDQFKAQAKAEMEPYYGQIFRQTDADLQKAIENVKKSYDANIRDIGLKYGNALENTQESYARRGLEFSSERDKAEQMLADETSRSIADTLDVTENQAYTLGRKAEDFLGTNNLPSYDLSVASGFTPIQQQAGKYGLTGATGSRNLFQPLGNITGTNERQQIYDEASRVNDLTQNERELRSLNYA